MTTEEILFRWINRRDGRGIARKAGNWIAKDIVTGDTAAAQSADRLADVLSRDPELPKSIPLPQSSLKNSSYHV